MKKETKKPIIDENKEYNTRIDAMTAVYCYFFPETRTILHEVEKSLPDEMYFVTSSAQSIELELQKMFKDFKVPKTLEGRINLDNIHVPIIQRIAEIYKPCIKDLTKFENYYPTSGSSEGIFHLLTNLKIKGVNEITVLEGEYEGYGIQAQNLGMRVNIIKETKAHQIKGKHWFISNPSAREGNIIPEEFIETLTDNNNKLILDFAYVGATKKHKYNTTNPNIIAAVMSFSKPYGVFRSRIGGMIFSKDPINTLYGNKWFKDNLRLFQGLKIVEDIGPFGLYDKYSKIQREIINDIRDQTGIQLKASDSLLLAYLTNKDAKELNLQQQELIAPFKREQNYRFCLTPYFEQKELQHKINIANMNI